MVRHGYDNATQEAISAFASTNTTESVLGKLVGQFTNRKSTQYDWPALFDWGNSCYSTDAQACALVPGCTQCDWSWVKESPLAQNAPNAKCRCKSNAPQEASE